MNIYIYLISSWVNILICLKAKIPVAVPAAQCPPLNGQVSYPLHSEKYPHVVIFSYDPHLDLCLVKSL